MRLPTGYSALRLDLGDLMQAARRRLRMKQEALAHDVGIARETLSRIEGGRAPRPQVLDRLMAALDLDWPEVAVEGEAVSERPFIEGYRGNAFCGFGRELQARRKAQDKSLRTLSAELGLSPSTLSRLERGQLSRSRVFREREGYAQLDVDDRPFDVAHSKLVTYLSS